MKKRILVLVTLASSITVLAVPAAASASPRTTTCGVGVGGPGTSVRATGVPCGEAWIVEEYWDHTEFMPSTVQIAGIRWHYRSVRQGLGTVRAYGQNLPRWGNYFTSGNRVIEIYSLPYG